MAKQGSQIAYEHTQGGSQVVVWHHQQGDGVLSIGALLACCTSRGDMAVETVGKEQHHRQAATHRIRFVSLAKSWGVTTGDCRQQLEINQVSPLCHSCETPDQAPRVILPSRLCIYAYGRTQKAAATSGPTCGASAQSGVENELRMGGVPQTRKMPPQAPTAVGPRAEQSHRPAHSPRRPPRILAATRHHSS